MHPVTRLRLGDATIPDGSPTWNLHAARNRSAKARRLAAALLAHLRTQQTDVTVALAHRLACEFDERHWTELTLIAGEKRPPSLETRVEVLSVLARGAVSL